MKLIFPGSCDDCIQQSKRQTKNGNGEFHGARIVMAGEHPAHSISKTVLIQAQASTPKQDLHWALILEQQCALAIAS